MTQEAETEVKQAAPQLAPCAVRTAPAIGTIHGKRCAGPLRPQQNALQRCAKSQVPEPRRRAAGGHVRGEVLGGGGSDVRITSNFFLGAVNWILRWHTEDDAMTPAEVADHFLDLFMNGIVARD